MTRRLYLVITRSSLLLIITLIAAPVVDFWRFGRFVPTGGGALPIGAILSGTREAEAKEPVDRERTGTVAPAPTPAPAGAPAPPVMLPASDRRVEVARAGSRPSPPSPASGFEAWTAWGQVDPFWDGVDRPVRQSAAAEPERLPEDHDAVAANDETAGAAASGESDPAMRAAKKSRHGHDRSLRASDDEPQVEATGDDEDRDEAAPGESPGDATPPIDGWIVGQPPQPAGSEDGRVTPDPSPLPPTSGGGVGAPRGMPLDPKPRPITFPSTWIDAPESVSIGEAFDVVVRVDSVERMTSLPFHLMFDATLIDFESAQAGPALASLQPVLLASVNPNRPGDLAVGLSLLEASGSFSGSGNLIMLRFRAIGSGRSDLAFSRATLRGGTSEPVETRFHSGAVVVR